jgi:hypothetical protein
VHISGNIHILVEQFWLGIVARLDIVENVGKKYYFELVEMEHLRSVNQKLIGVIPGTVLCSFMQNLV